MQLDIPVLAGKEIPNGAARRNDLKITKNWQLIGRRRIAL